MASQYDQDQYDEWMEESEEEMAKGSGGSGATPPMWVLRNQNIRIGAERSTKIHCYPGIYIDGKPIYTAYSLWLQGAKKRFIIDNTFGGKLDVPCVVSHYRAALEAAGEDPKALMSRPKTYINAVILEDFHWVERTTDKGKKFTEPVRCSGKDAVGRPICKMCAEGLEVKFGLNRFLALGPGYWRDFRGIIKRVRETCKNCGGILVPHKYVCANPKCSVVLADLGVGTVTEERRKHFENDKIACPVCGKVGKAKALYGCYHKAGGSETLVPGCNKPEPCQMFDMPLRLKTQSEGKNSSLICVNTAEDFKYTLMDPRAAGLVKPFDFIAMFGHMDCKEQADLLGRPNPFTGEGGVGGGEEASEPTDPYEV